MAGSEQSPTGARRPRRPLLSERPQPRPRLRRGIGLVLLALIAAGVLAAAVSSLQLDRVGEALVSARPGWLAAALVLMMSSLLARSVSWRQVLRAAIPDVEIGRLLVARATMIGVLGSAVFPGRLGEPSRVVVVARRLPDSTRRMLAVVAGTVFSQTLINLLALAILAAITFTSVPLLQSKASALAAAVAAPLAIVALVLILPPLLRRATRARSPRLRAGALTLTRLLRLARQGLTVFARPRHGAPAVLAQLLAWALQWSSCYLVLLALNLQSHDGLAAAAAVLLAVNVSAAVPATPSNVGVFQAVCIAVLAFYGVGYGPALAYGILLQAVEVLTALALGMPALLGEGMTWQDIRSAREQVAADAPPSPEPRPQDAAAPHVGAGARD